VRPEGLGKLRKSIHLIGSRTRDLPARIIVFNSSFLNSVEFNDQLNYSQIHKKVFAALSLRSNAGNSGKEVGL
jgi:hypothetical protein